MSTLKLVLLAGVFGWVLSSSAHADIIKLTASLDGGQEVPANVSPALGNALITIDNVTNFLTWDINWAGLSGPATAMHFHSAPPGVNGSVVVNIGNISGLTSPSIGSTTITSPQTTDLLSELWYINIHTAQFPGGEIRGQARVVPEPRAVATLMVMALAAALLWRRRRRAAVV